MLRVNRLRKSKRSSERTCSGSCPGLGVARSPHPPRLSLRSRRSRGVAGPPGHPRFAHNPLARATRCAVNPLFALRLGEAVEPKQREGSSEHRKDGGGKGRVGGELRLLVPYDELGGEILVDGTEVGFGVRVEVLLIGDLRDLLERRLVERRALRAALEANDRARRAAYADRVDAYASARRLIHDVERRRELVVLPIGEQHDRGGGMLTRKVGGDRGARTWRGGAIGLTRLLEDRAR